MGVFATLLTVCEAKKIQSGACPRIGFLFKIETFSENKQRHTYDISGTIFCEPEEFGQKGILGLAPRQVLPLFDWREAIP